MKNGANIIWHTIMYFWSQNIHFTNKIKSQCQLEAKIWVKFDILNMSHWSF